MTCKCSKGAVSISDIDHCSNCGEILELANQFRVSDYSGSQVICLACGSIVASDGVNLYSHLNFHRRYSGVELSLNEMMGYIMQGEADRAAEKCAELINALRKD